MSVCGRDKTADCLKFTSPGVPADGHTGLFLNLKKAAAVGQGGEDVKSVKDKYVKGINGENSVV